MNQTYQDLTSDRAATAVLTEGSDYSSDNPAEGWEKARKFIASALTHSGSLLDIGCANGFLLKSLQAWSNFSIDPYGLDQKEEYIAFAQTLFPDSKTHFVLQDLDDFLRNYPSQFPTKFDFIYWAVWTNRQLDRKQIETLLGHVLRGGRLILGFYPDNDDDPSDLHNNIATLQKLFPAMTVVTNDLFENRHEQLAIFDLK